MKIRGEGEYPQTYELLHISPAVFTDAVEVFDRYSEHSLSFTDATSIAILDRHDIDQVLVFDDDFDGIVDRLAPGSV